MFEGLNTGVVSEERNSFNITGSSLATMTREVEYIIND
jgi:hypothetical protein